MAAAAPALPAFLRPRPASPAPPSSRPPRCLPLPPRLSTRRRAKLLPAISGALSGPFIQARVSFFFFPFPIGETIGSWLGAARPRAAVAEKAKGAAAAADEGELEGMPPEFYDEEWQEGQRERTKEWHAYRQKEEAEEEKITNEYREIGMRLKSYPQEEVCKARILVSSFIRAGEDVEEEIVKAAERGELTELILLVIWNRLDVARRDDERDAIRSLDLLYRRVETEILKSEATPAMRLLNELLYLHDGADDDNWLKKCRKHMMEVFPREDPLTMVFPAGYDMEKQQGQIKLPPQGNDVLLRVDFVREVDELLKEVDAEQEKNKVPTGNDPESVAIMLKHQEKLRTIHQVESLLELASSLKW